MSGTNSGLCTNCTKFRKYSIASTKFEIRPNTDERNDFTLCAWVYPVKYDDTDFTMIDYGTGRGFNFAFIESNNGLYGNGDKIVVAVDYEETYNAGRATFNSWRHYAITKKGNIVYFFKNGKMINSRTLTDNRYFDDDFFTFKNMTSSGAYSYGINTDNNFYLDDFVFISNQCLWTSDYTVPKEPLIGDIGNASTLWDNLNIFETKNIPHDDDTDAANGNVLLNCY